MLNLKKSLAILSASLTLFFLGGCGDREKKEEGEKVLLMGTTADNPPFEFHQTSSGEDRIVGFDLDVAKAIAEILGVKLKVEDLEFSGLIPALQSGRVDFVMALMTPTEERKRNVDFSDTYFISQIAVVSMKGKDFKSEADLENKKIGAQLASNNEKILKEIAQKRGGIEIISLNKLGDLIQELRSGRLDGVVVETLPAKAFVEANSDLTYSLLEEHQTRFAIAFPKGSSWVTPFNEALQKLKASGRMEQIMRTWLKG